MAARRAKAEGGENRAGRGRARRKGAEPASRGLAAGEVAEGSPPAEVRQLGEAVEEAGGRVLARYRDPLGGHWLTFASLPLERVAPTPFQRDVSEPHVVRLSDAISKIDTFVDPVVAVPVPDDGRGEAGTARFWTPNGLHRLRALERLGGRSIVALVSADPGFAYRILALNTEKAHTTRERALEAVRMARGLSDLDPRRPEREYAFELEDGSLVTLGLAYEERPRFAGGAYAAALRASDAFLDEPIAKALVVRTKRAKRLLALDERVGEIVAALRERGFESPYLRNFVVARLRPFRPRGKPAPDAEALLDHMEKAAAKFDPERVRADQLAAAAGGGDAGE
jgi:ParB family chromosome partitioning protein